MPTLVNIGLNDPTSGYFNYYIGPPDQSGNCPGILYDYENNTTIETGIQVDLESPDYGFLGGETTYCYKICEWDVVRNEPICCCEGTGTTTPVPAPGNIYDRYSLSLAQCCNSEQVISIQLLLDEGTTAPVQGTVYEIGGECYSVTNVGTGGGGATHTNLTPVSQGCDNEQCTCVYNMLRCVDNEPYLLVEFTDGYQPSLGPDGDIYNPPNGPCTYFTLSSGQSDITLTAGDLQIGARCESCNVFTERISIKSCKTGQVFEVLVEGTPGAGEVINWSSFYMGGGTPLSGTCYEVLGAASNTNYTIDYNVLLQISDCNNEICPQ